MWEYNQSQELKHFGVMGMKWGKRRAGYTTVSQANRNAKNAMRTAYKESSAKDKANGVTGIGSGRKRLNNARAGMEAARKESLLRDGARPASARIDKKIGKIENLRAYNKKTYEHNDAQSKIKYEGKQFKLDNALAKNKAQYDMSETINNFRLAKQKAKKDPNYKNSDEYKKAKAANAKQNAQVFVYGVAGHERIETLKNKGYSEKRAKGETAAIQVATTIGLMTIASVAAMYSR